MPEWDRSNLAEFLRLAETDVDAAAKYISDWPEKLARGNGRESLLHYLAVEDEYHAVEALIRAGADLRDPLDWSTTPVYDAALLGYGKLLDLLLRHGCSPSTENAGIGSSALQTAIEHGHAECVQLLLSAGADVEQGSGLDGRPLHTAAQSDQVEFARMLLDAGADPNSLTPFDENTALHFAAQRACFPMVRLLLDHGALPRAVNAHGDTPGDFAAAAGILELVMMLWR